MSQTSVVPVPLPDRGYEIHIGPGLLTCAAGLIAPVLRGRQVFLVWDENVRPHRDALMDALSGYEIRDYCIPAGEPTKCSAQLVALWDALAELRFGRDCAVAALGGGVAGDLVGFLAASYMRGVDFIQIPTSLLAMVDSSVGGKTGINSPVAKNLIGAFWQPKIVIADINTLQTLDRCECISALAEIIKYGVIYDAGFFTWLEQNIEAVRELEPEPLVYAIRRSCEIKAEVVIADERESGLRKILNFGHTIGHAIENTAGYGAIRHGEAIAIGMAAESAMARRIGIGKWSHTDHQRLIDLIHRAGLPVSIPSGFSLDLVALLAAAKADKKNRSGQIRYALPVRMGEVSDETAPLEETERALREAAQPPA